MNKPFVRHLGFALVILLVVLFIPTFITAQEEGPPIPHQLEKRGDCLGCHAEGKLGAPVIPDNTTHADQSNDTCQDCHKHVTPPAIPHTLVGRENCLQCHETNEEGAVVNIEVPPAQEAPSEEEAEPAPTPMVEPVPTPVTYFKIQGVNTCLDCHLTLEDDHLAEMATQWQRSIHAERDVSCVDCHGGDSAAKTKEEAKAPETGYIGIPAKTDIPALCGSCHADVVAMRQYDLPTDQYAKYQESVHGLRLAESDLNVATCFDCHGGHQILKANDPASTVYPSNVPTTCANCHADEELMAPYDIPTNQFSLYKQSVHGHALLDNQDFRAPNCATCHGTHGAAPPGFEEVANVCGSCHSATQDNYLKSPHASDDELSPKCVNCHGRYDVSEPSEAMYLGGEARHCGECHSPDSEPSQVAQTLHDDLTAAAGSYEEAEAAIEEVRGLGMLVAQMEGRLREANTDLVSARAVQHTLNVDAVQLRTDEVITITNEVKADAQAAIAENLFRRQAMIIAIVAIGITIVPLYLIKRELDQQLEESDF